MKELTAIGEKFNRLHESLLDQQTFVMADVVNVLPELEKSTRYWLMAELVKHGYVKRVRRGIYAFNELMGKKNISLLSDTKRLFDTLSETGFYYYVSGLDILAKYMQHVPEQYPVILFVEKMAKEEIKAVLLEQGYLIMDPTELKTRYEEVAYAGRKETQIVLYVTENFEFEDEGLATLEKAFVDTYYSVTRNGYPLSLQELVRIYENLIRTGNFDQKRALTIANRRGIQYDIRYIVESKYVTEDARRFVDIMRRG